MAASIKDPPVFSTSLRQPILSFTVWSVLFLRIRPSTKRTVYKFCSWIFIMKTFVRIIVGIACVRDRCVGMRDTFANRVRDASLDSAIIGRSMCCRESKITRVKVDPLLSFVSYNSVVLKVGSKYFSLLSKHPPRRHPSIHAEYMLVTLREQLRRDKYILLAVGINRLTWAGTSLSFFASISGYFVIPA